MPLFGIDTGGSTIGASTFGEDALSRHRYALGAWFGLQSGQPGFVGTYNNHTFFPGITLRAAHYLSYAPLVFAQERRSYAVEEIISEAGASMAWPLYRHRDWSLNLGTSYNLSFRNRQTALSFDPFGGTPFIPSSGRFASGRVSLSFSNLQRYTDSISIQKGIRVELAAKLEHPYLFSSYESSALEARASAYVENPLLSRHVLAMNAMAGFGTSSYVRRNLYAVSGVQSRDILLAAVMGDFYSPSGGLRGFDQQLISGNAIGRGNIEYRFPLMDVHETYETLPFAMRRLVGTLFFDFASLAPNPGALWGEDNLHRSIGAELSVELEVGYGFGLMAKAGYGWALGDVARAGYLRLGQSF